MDFREINKLNWRLNLNNNNSLVEYSSAVNKYTTSDVPDEHPKLLRQIDCATGATMGTKQKQAPTTPASASAIGVEDEGCGGGGGVAVGTGTGTGTGDCAAAAAVAALQTEGSGVVGDKIGGAAAYCALDLDVAGYGMAAAAAALSPTDAAFGGGGGLSSSRTSMNNSTENLSYASDNFYGDDLILLDDDDVEAEEISLNSDDCVYAYRGDGADFDLSLDAAAMGRGGRHHLDFGLPVGMPDLLGADDETEFLEMDFEPDPSSELEFASGAQELGGLPQANLLLMQRDYSQMSGMGMVTPTQGRQLYSSPIDDFPQEDALQQQKQRLNKKFARISLNLDQIKDGTGNGVDMDLDELIGGAEEEAGCHAHVGGQLADTALAQSLPSTLYTGSSFSRSTSVPSDHPEPKLTGAKPKRLSNSSSVMSKSSSSSKSRRSQPSASFDERCYSCTDFRATSASSCQQLPLQGADTVAPMLVAAAAVVAMAASSSSMAHFDLTSSNEDNCLDCLEKEFLANTIGKALDMSTCPKCRRRVGSNRGSSLSLYTRAEQTRCRSGSPGYFDEAGGLFAGWHSGAAGAGPSLGPAYNQRFISCDNNFGGVQLLKQSFSTEPLVARLSTGQLCDEEHLVQALDKLHISYDKSLLHTYFQQLSKPVSSTGNLKQLLLQASKRQCNHRKLKKLIEMATQQQLHVQFKRTNDGEIPTALVPVKVSDILDSWARHRDLSVLRQLDARFHRANVLGKVGQIVRQAAAASFAAAAAAATSTSTSATRRALPELLMIPQYYDSGELTLTRKC
ncbi:uncharacterized protein LOC117902442 [Drosophila subobscura]|uniref:uncharacterized protein LOC117902442 n=1 Tax=Drosophila subobscura TaxID=7241 RepID=UPI00155AA946|nr:uncharacterized protein LOC117902442 [Drosophila subobscura]